MEYGNCIAIKRSNELLDSATGCVLIGLSLSSSLLLLSSFYYTKAEIDNGVSLLERCLMNMYELFGRELPVSEPAWPGGKALGFVSGRTQVRLPASAHRSLRKSRSIDTSCDFALHN